ncbi:MULTISPECIES: SH3 domain-containing protein [unclassified Xanthobacter]|uniref:SH3 domain-containing protein n=2 Tax=Xanthobacter TaxID=279 RepID=UPI001EFF3183|nr:MULTISPECIES: SH3 domain-containing protein [unclassified Xanthobacter]
MLSMARALPPKSPLRNLTALALAAVVTLAGAGMAVAAEDGTSGLPVPRFVSLKADKVNVRNGPNKDQDVAWVFSRSGLPVEVTAEFETWRRIRDADGAEGWVYHSMLSLRRTALVAPWLKNETVVLRAEPNADARVVARLEPGVLGNVKKCDGKFCRLTGEGFDGYVQQSQLFGVYPDEKIE